MRRLNVSHRTFSACAAIVLLAGCGGSQPPIAAHDNSGSPWMQSDVASQDLLYAQIGSQSSTGAVE